jgi:transcription initiation factor TFIID TATA-box-binding protein
VGIIRSTGEDAEVVRVDVNNIVCKARINLTKTLDTVYSAFDSDNIEYEPEQFPALIYKNWGVSFLLFSSGSLIVTGAKDVDTASKAIQQFRKLLKNI